MSPESKGRNDLAGILKFLRRWRRYIASGAGLGIAAAMLYILFATPMFLGSATVLIEDLRKAPVAQSNAILGGDSFSDDKVIRESSRSYPIAQRDPPGNSQA